MSSSLVNPGLSLTNGACFWAELLVILLSDVVFSDLSVPILCADNGLAYCAASGHSSGRRQNQYVVPSCVVNGKRVLMSGAVHSQRRLERPTSRDFAGQ